MLTYNISDLLVIVGYADFVRYPDSRKSTSGYIILLAGGAISWKSMEQKLTTVSTVELELVACYEVITQVVRLRNLIIRLKVVDSLSRPIKMLCDNEASISSITNGNVSNGNKHMDVKFCHKREM